MRAKAISRKKMAISSGLLLLRLRFLLRLIGLLGLLLNLSPGIRIRWWRYFRILRRCRRGLRRLRCWRQSSVALLVLEFLESRVDQFPHTVLHLLQVGQLHHHRARFLALIAALAGH